MATNQAIVEVDNLVFRYGGTEVLHSISFG
jgi:hypothetical protein